MTTTLGRLIHTPLGDVEGYQAYLQSAWWQLIRRAAIRLADHKCQDCGFNFKLGDRRRWIEIHHLTYERLGGELPDDVTVLCNLCHATRGGFAPEPRGSRYPQPVTAGQALDSLFGRPGNHR